MAYRIRLVQVTSLRTNKEWYKEYVGNYYAVLADPFDDSDPNFGGTYLTYDGIGTSVSTRLFKENINVLTLPFLSDELDEKTKELGIDITYNYANDLVFCVFDSLTCEQITTKTPFPTYGEAMEYVKENKLCYIQSISKKEEVTV